MADTFQEDVKIIRFEDIAQIKEDSLAISDDQDPLMFENSDAGNFQSIKLEVCSETNMSHQISKKSKPPKEISDTHKPRKPAKKFYLHNHLVLYCQKCDKTYQKVYGEKLTHCPTCKEWLFSQCITCGKRYKNYCDITMHIKYNCGKPKRFTCIECGYEARRKDQLKDHHKTQHQNLKPPPHVRCRRCDKTFRLERYRRWHEKHECASEMIQQCPHCDFTTKYQSSLHTHVKNVHNRDESIKHGCENCNKEFKSRSALLTHKRTKCGKNPNVECDHCGYKTYQKYPLMVTHINRNHPELFPKGEFHCKLCGKNVYHLYGINRHLKSGCMKTEKSESKPKKKNKSQNFQI